MLSKASAPVASNSRRPLTFKLPCRNQQGGLRALTLRSAAGPAKGAYGVGQTKISRPGRLHLWVRKNTLNVTFFRICYSEHPQAPLANCLALPRLLQRVTQALLNERLPAVRRHKPRPQHRVGGVKPHLDKALIATPFLSMAGAHQDAVSIEVQHATSPPCFIVARGSTENRLDLRAGHPWQDAVAALLGNADGSWRFTSATVGMGNTVTILLGNADGPWEQARQSRPRQQGKNGECDYHEQTELAHENLHTL
jgi:hypothetical protein